MTDLNLSIEALPSSHQTGKLNIKHLMRYWYSAQLARNNITKGPIRGQEWQTDQTLLAALKLGLEQTLMYLSIEGPSFEQFEDWIIATSGIPDQAVVNRFNDLFSEEGCVADQSFTPFFSDDEMAFWDQNGYIVVKNAVSREDCDATIQVICDFIGVERDDPSTWYTPNPARQGIMVQLFQHALLEKNRNSLKIKMAYEHLWQRRDIWLNTDRVGFNPPETNAWKFPGPRLHWDCKLEPPIPFGTQGILYLADTEANQGAFTLVPGFQHQLDDWLNALPAGKQVHDMDLYALGPHPIVAGAGDFVIWHHALPHGSSANTSDKPRFVQYINYSPADFKG